MKKSKLILILLTLLLIVSLKAQDYTIQWRKGAKFPLRLSELKAIACNDKIYVIGGKITNDISGQGQ